MFVASDDYIYDDYYSPPRLSEDSTPPLSSHAMWSSSTTPTPIPFVFEESMQVPTLSASASFSSFTGHGLVPSAAMSRRMSSVYSFQAPTPAGSFASFSGYYNAVPAFGDNAASPFTNIDDTNVIEELFDPGMGRMLETLDPDMDVMLETLDHDIHKNTQISMEQAFDKFYGPYGSHATWDDDASLDILDEVGSQIDASSHVEPDARSSAETCGSASVSAMDEFMRSFSPPNLTVAPHLTFNAFPFEPVFPHCSCVVGGLFAPAAPFADANIQDGGNVSCADDALDVNCGVQQDELPAFEPKLQNLIACPPAADELKSVLPACSTIEELVYEPAQSPEKRQHKKARQRGSSSGSIIVASPAAQLVENVADEIEEKKEVKKVVVKKRVGKLPSSCAITPRKRGQNRDAAQRYRQRKKKLEKTYAQTLDELERENVELRAEHSKFRQEFDILRSLVAGV